MKTIIVSNRLPIHLEIENNCVEAIPSVGGLATGIKSIVSNRECLWVGWGGLAEEDIRCDALQQKVDEIFQKHNFISVELNKGDIENYYNGFSNRTLWPLFHYFTENVEYRQSAWENYKDVNRRFAEAIVAHAKPGDQIWVHDFHLMMVPHYIKQLNPQLRVGFFLHIPFPSYEIFRTLPCRKELLEHFLAADLIGFHTHDYERHFLETISYLLHSESKNNQIIHRNSVTTVGCFPMGIDVERFESAVLPEEVSEISTLQKELESYTSRQPDVKLIVSIDRMDYTKGIPRRLKAFAYFLKKYPQYREKIRLLMVAVPSRRELPHYQNLKKEVDELVGNINGLYSTIDWSPVWYFYRELPFEELIALYRGCSVALLTPERDGMNLVAKEYIAARTDNTGVLILSEMAGAACELTEALIINPTDYREVAQAISRALKMPVAEQKQRNKTMRTKLQTQDVFTWANSFLYELQETNGVQTSKIKYLSSAICDNIQKIYRNSGRRMFLLDYDGSLIDFKDDPNDARPDRELTEILGKLARSPKKKKSFSDHQR